MPWYRPTLDHTPPPPLYTLPLGLLALLRGKNEKLAIASGVPGQKIACENENFVSRAKILQVRGFKILGENDSISRSTHIHL
jgi:hypothetical protein